VSLFTFNVGVELGQLAALAVAVPVLSLLMRRVNERLAVIVMSALVAHTAWHWMLERGATLRGYDFAWPALDLAFAASAMRALMVLVIIGGAAWLMAALGTRLSAFGGGNQPADSSEPRAEGAV
jgi:hypothetical protein